MRIDRLHLKAFGPFRDRTLDLHADAPGVHLVYGDNEAGKSSALRALHAALFGIDKNPANTFLVEKDHLRVGADLRAGEATLSFLRRRRNKKMLWDLEDTAPLPDDSLEPFLHGLQPDHFRDFFGMGHDELVAGGKMLARGEVDLGTALFAAAGGIRHLAALLGNLSEEGGALFKPQAQKPVINAAIKAYRDARKAERDASLSTDAWETLHLNLGQKRADRDAVSEKLADCNARLERLRRFTRAAPAAAKRNHTRAALAPLTDAPCLPEDFRGRYEEARVQAKTAAQSIKDAEDDLKRINAEIDALEIDTLVLEHSADLEELLNDSADLVALEKRCANESEPIVTRLDTAFEKLCEKLGHRLAPDEATQLDVSEALAERISALSRDHAALLHDQRHAAANLARVEKRLKQLTDDAGSDAASVDLEQLAALLESTKADRDLEGRIQDVTEEAAGITRAVDARLKRLAHLDAGMEALLAFRSPSRALMTRHRDDQDTARQDVGQAEKVLADARDHCIQLTRRLEESRAVDAPPTENELHAVRAARDAAWKSLREGWNSGSGDSEALRELSDTVSVKIGNADDMVDRMRREADRVAEIAQLAIQLNQGGEKVAAGVENLESATARLETLDLAWQELWADCGITKPGSPAEMLEWDLERAQLVEQAEKVAELQARADSARAAAAATQERIISVLPADGTPPQSLGEALARLEGRVLEERDRAGRQKSRKADIKRLRDEELPDATRHVEDADAALENWQETWQRAMSEIDTAPDASPEQGVARVTLLRQLAACAAERMQAQAVLNQCATLDRTLRDRVTRLAERSGLQLSWESALQFHDTLTQCLETQRQAASKRVLREADVQAKAATLAKAQAALLEANTKLDLYRAEAGGAALEDLPDIIARADQRRKLEENLENFTDFLLGEAQGTPLDTFLAELDADADDTRAHRCREIEREQAELDESLNRLSEEIVRLEVELEAMDGSAAAAEARDEAAAQLALLEEYSETYIRIRLGEGLLLRAIERFRDLEQGPILGRAGEIFSRITLGRFAALTTDYVRDQPVLKGQRSDKSKTLVALDGMSEGTADQLYLALRLAALERYFESHEPVPLVLDDLLVNFDDARAGVTLEVLGEMAQHTQVILFTHHKHLRELAQQHLPKEQLHTSSLSESVS